MAEINFNNIYDQMSGTVKNSYDGAFMGQSFADQYDPGKRTVNADGTVTDTNPNSLTMKEGYNQMVDAYNQEQQSETKNSFLGSLANFGSADAAMPDQTYGLQDSMMGMSINPDGSLNYNNTQPQNLGFRSMVDMANDANNFDSQFSYPASQPQNLGFIESAPQPKEAIYQDRIMNNNLPSYGYEPRQGILQGLQDKIGAGFNNVINNPVTRGLGTALNFARGSLPGMIMSGIGSLFSRNPNAPSYQTRSPNIDYSNLNTTNLNDFYDSNEDSDTFGTTRFDRAKPGSFGSYRTLADYFNRNKTAAAALTTKKAKKEAAMQQQIKDAEARQAELNRRQSIVNAQTARGFTTSGGSGNYSSSKDHSGAGGYGGKGRASNEARSNDLGFSDIRLKDNIELVGKSPSDINIYNFTYLNDPKVYQGVMAQEVPWASVKHDSGYLMVDYSKIDVEFKRKDAVASMFTRRR